VHDPDKPRLMQVTDPDRDLFSCMRGERGLVWYLLAWTGGLTLPTLLVIGLIAVVAGG
jgi:hypothetical protein